MGTSINKTSAVYLKNNSGQTVTKGDVVILDKSLAGSFTLTGSNGYTGSQPGVVLDQTNIANGTSCLVAIGGYVPVINLLTGANVGDTIGLSSVVKRGIPHANILAGDFGQVLSAGSTPDAILWGESEKRGEFVGARYYANTGSIVNGTETFVGAFPVKDYDTHNAYLTGSANTLANGSRFTAPISGYYQIHISVGFAVAAWGAGTYTEVYFYLNGTTFYYNLDIVTSDSASTNTINPNGFITIFLNKGDYITPGVYQTSSSTKQFYLPSQSFCYIEIIKVG